MQILHKTCIKYAQFSAKSALCTKIVQYYAQFEQNCAETEHSTAKCLLRYAFNRVALF